MFVGHIVLVWRALWRVLRDDGTCWLNFGDSYANTGVKDPSKVGGFIGERIRRKLAGDNPNDSCQDSRPRKIPGGLKQKDLIGIPWRVALALQADGWWLRSDIIWAKGLSFCPTYSGSCMPESCKDRPTKGHEFVFLLSKSARYYYDGIAVREANASDTNDGRRGDGASYAFKPTVPVTHMGSPIGGRNLRTVWTINPGNFKGAHFATFPSALVEPMIKAGTSERGCCPECGKAWERVATRQGKLPDRISNEDTYTRPGYKDLDTSWHKSPKRDAGSLLMATTGWRPSCQCPEQEPVPCVVLDPFGGSGTVGDVARQLGRRWVMIELSQEYCDDHIIPRLEEPLIEWAQEQPEPDPEPEQMRFTL
jgi:DNA modification methylase